MEDLPYGFEPYDPAHPRVKMVNAILASRSPLKIHVSLWARLVSLFTGEAPKGYTLPRNQRRLIKKMMRASADRAVIERARQEEINRNFRSRGLQH